MFFMSLLLCCIFDTLVLKTIHILKHPFHFAFTQEDKNSSVDETKRLSTLVIARSRFD